ncbi:hypothetical protein [Variovorax sp. KK3]|uniref:hypothetical protein n=1 Tax=Variovorax sp. KK3 TaxID=1855728 RepID=UPI00118005AF|nr:hypothetical protein [Variovorax sp. KK3]
MNKPEFNLPGNPYNVDAIPQWFEPDLWKTAKHVPLRRTNVALLYALSMAGFTAVACTPFYRWLGVVSGFASPRALGV